MTTRPIFTLRAQMNLYAGDTDEAFRVLAEHFTTLAANKVPEQDKFCGGMMTLDPAEQAPSAALVPSELMRLIVKCKGNFQLLPQHERFKARELLAYWERHEKRMAPPDGGTDASKEGTAAAVSEPAGTNPQQRPPSDAA